ncbi:DUF2971 domain-containing protein [Oceanobacillus sp. CF4.6]|uniref:DUF2971 domain-containing protein n=1 Tax=Oceanobacillus sp. CF4.6 TaxID=3373080 RepID=UPI003EE429D0
MDLKLKGNSFGHAMQFESIYDYSEQYKVKGNLKVWKYMDLNKLDSLLKNKALFFAKSSAFIDPLEGSYSNWDINQLDDELELTYLPSKEEMRKIQDFSAISCWHINDYESAGMWDLYLRGDDGVSIQTDYINLLNSITDLRYRVFSGKLQYIDFHKEMTSKNIYDTLFYKRKSFSHENELRLMIVASRIDQFHLESVFERQGIPVNEWQERMEMLEEQSYEFSHNNGTLVSCGLDKLIKKVYVSPRSSQEIVEMVTEMITKYGLSKNKVIQSDLYKDFIY